MQHTDSRPQQPLRVHLRRLRVARGLTQAALAERAGVSRSYVQALELGVRRSPALPTLQRLAQALGVEIRLRIVDRQSEAPRSR